jgi:REP element-mobilizing transposase RayT
VEVTARTIQGRPLLRPSPDVNEIVAGVLGRAQRLYEPEVCAFVVMSSHFHLLLRVDHGKQLADFMRYFNSNVAREIVRLTGWTDKVFSRRYRGIVVSDEMPAQRERLVYILSHGAKEDLVETPRDWPSLHAVRALLDDEPVEGTWYDRTKESAALRRGKELDRSEYTTAETVVLSPLPCWKDLPREEQKARVAEVVQEIEEETAARRKRTGVRPLGRNTILKQDPLARPKRLKKSPAPLFHAATKRVREDLRAAYFEFFAAFREAAEQLKAGILPVVFPAGSFPPALPFVGG